VRTHQFLLHVTCAFQCNRVYVRVCNICLISVDVCLFRVVFVRWHGRQVLEDEEPEYGGMIADTIYIFQGALSLEVSQSPNCAHLFDSLCLLFGGLDSL